MPSVEETRRDIEQVFDELKALGCVDAQTPFLELVRYIYLTVRGKRRVYMLEAYPDMDTSTPTQCDRQYFMEHIGHGPAEKIRTSVDIFLTMAHINGVYSANLFFERYIYETVYRGLFTRTSFIYKMYLLFFDDARIPIVSEIALSPDDPVPTEEDMCHKCYGPLFYAAKFDKGILCLDCATTYYRPAEYYPDTAIIRRVQRTYPNTFEKYSNGRIQFKKMLVQRARDRFQQEMEKKLKEYEREIDNLY